MVKGPRSKMMQPARHKNGFTLVETLVATVILCSSVLVLGAVGTRCLAQARLNRQYDLAAALADRQLSFIDYLGVGQFIEMGQTQGRFDELEPGYAWYAITESQGVDNLYKVTITVSWIERGNGHSISVDTMLDGMAMLTVPASETR